MIQTVIMPKLDQSVEESTVVKWHKQEGDTVRKGDVLFEIETEKTSLEIESFFDGTLLKIIVEEGRTVPVMTPVAYIGQPGDAIPETEPVLPTTSPAQKTAASSPPAFAPPKAETPVAPAPSPEPVQTSKPSPAASSSPARKPVSPRARRLIRESAISAGPIPGTGPNGRVEEKDVQAYLEAKGYASLKITPAARNLARDNGIDLLALEVPEGEEGITEEIIQQAIAEKPVPLSTMRQVIARRLTESFTTAPHFFTTVSVDMTDLLSLREQWKREGKRLSVTDFILQAVASALVEFPLLNSSTDGVTVRRRSRVHLGLAVSLSEGLVVPVIRDAQDLDLAEIHERAASLAAKARDGKLAPTEMTGSTFTVSNMGMLNVENFTAIINPGESAILAVASVQPVPAVHDGNIEIRSMMKITLSADHRLIDGAMAAGFVNHIKSQLENLELWKSLYAVVDNRKEDRIMKYHEIIQSRIQRQKRFFASNQAGEVLFCRIGSSWGGDYLLPQVQHYWLDNVLSKRTVTSLKKEDIGEINNKFLEIFRTSFKNYFRFDDDAVPNIEVYFGTGDMTAAMSGGAVQYSSGTSWSDPVVHQWEDLDKLKFNPENVLVEFHRLIYQDLANKWEEDFLMVPFLHRSPLDAALGLRGSDIFFDLTDNPQFVKDLTNWCAEWSIRFEKYISSNTVIPEELERGVWGVWLPEGGVWVNGDPVDLISGDMQQEFERPSTEKLFTTLGGGFFHHHAKGIRQVTNISKTKGMIIQNIVPDPKEPDPLTVLLNDPKMRDRFLEASMIQPIHLVGDNNFYNNIDKILPILAEGRFIIRHEGDDEMSGEIIAKIKKVRKNN